MNSLSRSQHQVIYHKRRDLQQSTEGQRGREDIARNQLERKRAKGNFKNEDYH